METSVFTVPLNKDYIKHWKNYTAGDICHCCMSGYDDICLFLCKFYNSTKKVFKNNRDII